MTLPTGRLLAACLRAAGADRVWGTPVAGVGVLPVPDSEVAARLADADGWLRRGVGWAVLGEEVVRASGGPGRPVTVVDVDDPRDLPEAVAASAARAGAVSPATVHLRLGFDASTTAGHALAGPQPGAGDSWTVPATDVVARLAAAEHPVVLAGPGVVRAGAVAGLHALAAAGSVGVLNTWGAKGVFDWRSRHHLATAGLQADDLALGGLAEADLVVACGVDPAEAALDDRPPSEVVEVAPAALDPLAEAWSRPRREIPEVALRARLGRLAQAAWTDDRVPLHPARITRDLAAVLGRGGLVAADPGTAGFYVARTFATTELGSVHVPGPAGTAGAAVATALAVRQAHPARPVLAVVDGPLDDASRSVLEVAASLGVAVPVEVWTPDGEVLTPAAHVARATEAIAAPRSRIVEVAVDSAPLAEFVAAAGPIVAWGGRSGS